MVSDIVGEEVFQDLVTAALRDVAGMVLPGSHTAMALAPHVGRAFLRILKKYRESDQPRILDAFTRLPFSWTFGIAAKRVAETDLDEDLKTELVKYLSAIPMTSRQALHRWDDGGHVTTLLSQLPHSPEQMARFLPIRPPHFLPGYKIPGYDFRLETLLGQGGFAEVWKARNTELAGQPPVALKFCLNEALLPSLKREIQLLDRLKGYSSAKDFVQLQQTAYSADPPFLVYEYIDGGNLANWLDSFEGRAPQPQEVISVLKMTARAVAVAHDNSIVHRDLKPANLMITREGRVKVGDFGIGAVMAESEARTADGRDGEATHPTLLHAAHTPVYSDPMRDRFAPPDPRDDVYAIGVVGYQLLIGNVASRMEGGWRRYLEVRGVPGDLIEVIDTCVAPPEQRYTSAGALLAALEVAPKTTKPKAEKPKAAKPKPRTPKPEPKPKPKAVMKFCHSCGARAPAAKRYCTVCGYRFPEQDA
ncbi:MAG: serine/threonine-protein kinase [Kiloniellaceae bacterium]